MKYTPCAIAFLMLTLIILPATAQPEPGEPNLDPIVIPPPPKVQFANGTEVTRRLLHELKFKPLTNWSAYDSDPADTLLIVFGDLSWLYDLDEIENGPRHGKLARFLDDGGAILIASNLPAPKRLVADILAPLCKVDVPEYPAHITTQDPTEQFRFADCPFILPISGDIADHLFGAGELQLKRVATNKPTVLTPLGQLNLPLSLAPLASFPPHCRSASIPENEWNQTRRLFAVGGQSGSKDGKILLLADHGVFLNMMMRQRPEDNDNFLFAMNTFTWLRESRVGPDGKRHQALFIEENGSISSRFDVPLRQMEGPEIPEIKPTDIPIIVSQIDQGLARLESENRYNTWLSDLEQRWHLGPQFWRVLAILGSLLLLIWMAWRVMFSATVPSKGGLPTLDRAVDGQTPQISTLGERQRALIQSGNLWEPARDLVREGFVRAGLDVTALSSPVPRFVARGSFSERRRLVALARRLWLLAFGAPRPVTPENWSRLPVEVEKLIALLQSGKVQIADPLGAARTL